MLNKVEAAQFLAFWLIIGNVEKWSHFQIIQRLTRLHYQNPGTTKNPSIFI
jgi:hypothetical protein